MLEPVVMDYDGPNRHMFVNDEDLRGPCSWCDSPLVLHPMGMDEVTRSLAQHRMLSKSRAFVARELGVDESEVF